MMEPDYSYATDAKGEDKPLEGLATIAEEAERAATYITAFITRFRHGNPAPSVGGPNTLKPVPSGHAGQIERLRDAVSVLDKLALELGTIG